MPATLISRSLGELELLVIGEHSPSADDWDRHCQRVQEAIATHKLAQLVAVVSGGGSPNAAQRKQFLQIIMAAPVRPKRIAVCTSSIVARGVMTAFTWFGMNGLRAFQFNDLSQAWMWLAPERLPCAELQAAVDAAQIDNGWKRLPAPTVKA